jgi:hypothetical protein
MGELPGGDHAPKPYRESEREVLADMHAHCVRLLGNLALKPGSGYVPIEAKRRWFDALLFARQSGPVSPGWRLNESYLFPSKNFYMDGSGDIRHADTDGQKIIARLQKFGLSRGISTYRIIGGQEHLGLWEYQEARLEGQQVVPIEDDKVYRLYRWYLGSDWHGQSWLSGECIFTESTVLYSTLTPLDAPRDAGRPDSMLHELSRIIDTYGQR